MPLAFDALAGEVSPVIGPLVTVKAESAVKATPTRKSRRIATPSTVARREGRQLARRAAGERVQDAYIATYTVATESAETVLGEQSVTAETVQVATPRIARKQARTPHGQGNRLPDSRYSQGNGIEPDTLNREQYSVHDIASSDGFDYPLERLAWANVRRKSQERKAAERWARKHASHGTSDRQTWDVAIAPSQAEHEKRSYKHLATS